MKNRLILIAAGLALLVSCKDEEKYTLNPVVMAKTLEFTYSDNDAAKFYVDENGSTVFPMVVGESVDFSYAVTPSLEELTNPEIVWAPATPPSPPWTRKATSPPWAPVRRPSPSSISPGT